MIINKLNMLVKKAQYLYLKFRIRLASPHGAAELMRNQFYYLGKNVELYTCSITEPYLISIHDNVVCAAHVRFINHDVSCFNIARYSKILLSEVDKTGIIELFENCFVGAYSILLPNTSVGANSIIAAGSVVTKHVPAGEVWGGAPARFIMTTDEYAKKVIEKSHTYPWIGVDNNKKDTVKLKQQYFFCKDNK